MNKGYLIVLFMAFIWTSCSNKDHSKMADQQGFQIDTIAAGGMQRMQVSDNETDVKMRGVDYHISIHRAPCDSLQHVKDPNGGAFIDNEITLCITRNRGEQVFLKTFTKKSFASLVEDNFLSKSILEGMVYDKVSDQGIVLAASVCYPQTDLYVPLSITIAPDGRMSMFKEEILDENYTGEDSI